MWQMVLDRIIIYEGKAEHGGHLQKISPDDVKREHYEHLSTSFQEVLKGWGESIIEVSFLHFLEV